MGQRMQDAASRCVQQSDRRRERREPRNLQGAGPDRIHQADPHMSGGGSPGLPRILEWKPQARSPTLSSGVRRIALLTGLDFAAERLHTPIRGGGA